MKEINDLLKLSGMTQLNESVEVEEAYANEPDEEYQTVDTIIRQGTDLNREKQQHPKGGFTGDNPLAEDAIDYDQVLDAIAALYGPDIYDSDAMGDLADDLEKVNPSPKELDFIIQNKKLPKRLQGMKFTNSDDIQFGEGNNESLAEEESDEDEVRELVIFIDNDGQLYQQQGAPIMRNLSRKWDKGIYDHDLAQKLWYYLAVNGAKKYGQDQGTGNGLKMFSPAVRRAAAKEMADNWMEELKAGNKMDEAEEDLEAMLAEILIGEESDEEHNSRPTRGYVSNKLEKTVADMEQNMDTDDVAGTGFEPVSISVKSPVKGQENDPITANFYKYRNQ